MAAPPPNSPTLTYIGLGSNLEQPIAQIQSAFQALSELPKSRLSCRSRLYRTPPLGPCGQPDYVNGVALLETMLDPISLLNRLQAIEQTHGRRRDGERWGPRTLDLDMLLYGEKVMNSERLILPHPEMHKRGFVLIPLADCAPLDLFVAGRGRLDELLLSCDRCGIESLD